MKKRHLPTLIILLILLATQTIPQETGALRGLLADSSSGEPLAFGNVLVKEINRGVSTDSKGYFLINGIPAPFTYTVLVSYVGYKPVEIEVMIQPNRVTDIELLLESESIKMQTVEKIGEKVNESNATDIGLQRIAVKDLEKLPQGVETDIFRSLQYVPGVKATGDISARYYVRGGASNQNLVLLNDVPIYNPFHALGMFSAIDPEMISSLEFYKGGFTSEYAGRASSVMRLITKDGNKFKYSGKGSVSSLTGKVLLEGPIPDGSFVVTGRKSYDTGVLDNFLNNNNIPIDFWDASFKLKYKNDKVFKDATFTLHGFFSEDNLFNENPFESDFKWRNKIIGIKWFQLSDKPLFYEVGFSLSEFEGEVIPNLSDAKFMKNFLRDFTLQMDFKYVYPSKDEINVGFKIQEIITDLFLENEVGEIGNIAGKKGANISVYGKYKFLQIDNFGADLGTRINMTRLSVGDAGTYFFEPRLSLTYRFSPMVAFKTAAGIYMQELTTLSDEDELISIFEPWFVTPVYIDPAQAIHYIAGFDINLSNEVNIEIEGYYKKINNFPSLNDEKFFPEDKDLVGGTGNAYGVEFLVRYQPKPFRFTFGYSLSEAKKTINLESGASMEFHPRYDSRHSINASAEWNIGDGWYASAVWTFYTGLPFTQILGFEDKLFFDDVFSNDNILFNYRPNTITGDRNASRLPNYHRMDLSLSKNFYLWKTRVYFDLTVINVYDRANIFYFEKSTGKRFNMLPFLPTASVKIEI